MVQYLRLLMVVALLAGTSACSSNPEVGVMEAPGVSSCVSAEEDDGTADCVNYAPDERVGSDIGVQDAVADAPAVRAVE
ncbi:hypothetical protein I2494_04225 [Budviciaceae bacterium BWR-B9]|uniref:Secreted protein n=1 Tax=Limnobaculum allomyrinae TaxID=2791986 RepID=A0ABS1INQ0_9GAMM|nr:MULTISPECIES: hypothetical protein [Limnobaculum]MBK5142930.1 hypothetical protein [Limnobaculum allomyrinae]MBV7690183.1 hypothetical protein [Limnobaculum sp. M2-1]